jgi:hypothetical protein
LSRDPFLQAARKAVFLVPAADFLYIDQDASILARIVLVGDTSALPFGLPFFFREVREYLRLPYQSVPVVFSEEAAALNT